MANKKDNDPDGKGGAYPPKGSGHKPPSWYRRRDKRAAERAKAKESAA